MELKENTRVRLFKFNGTTSSEDECDPGENYWKLIGLEGKVVRDPNEASLYSRHALEPRVLVVFDTDIKSMGLHCHNSIENSLWILVSDLEVLA